MKLQVLIDQVLEEAMRLGQMPHNAYRSYWEAYNPIISFFQDRDVEDYSPEAIQDYLYRVTERYQNGEIQRERCSKLATTARRTAHFEHTGTYLFAFPKRGSRYELDAYYTGLMNFFPVKIFIRILRETWNGRQNGTSIGFWGRGSQIFSRWIRKSSRSIFTDA